MAPGQTTPLDPGDQEKADKEHREHIVQMLDDLVTTGTALKLPENRAIVFATAGDIYWRYDQKRARDLFRDVGTELGAYNQDFEREQRENIKAGRGDMYEPGDPRPQVLPIIAKHDAAMAMDIMMSTRRPSVAEAMARASQGDSAAASSDPSGRMSADRNRAATELFLEQQIALAAADQDPDTAIRMIKESLSRGVTYSVFGLLQKLYALDAKKAAELGGDVVKKVLDIDLGKNREAFDMTVMFLQSSIPPKTAPPGPQGPQPAKPRFTFDDSEKKDLAGKLADAALQMPMPASVSQVSRASSILERVAPDKAAALKQRLQEAQRSTTSGPSAGVGGISATVIGSGFVVGANTIVNGGSFSGSWNGNSTPEQIIGAYPRMTSEAERAQATMILTSKINALTDEAAAKRLIDQIPDESSRAKVQTSFETFRTFKLTQTGKLEEARRQLPMISNTRQRLSATVSLALAFQKIGKDADIESAKALMRDARSLVAENPDNAEDISGALELVRGYAVIDPDTAFRIFEPVIAVTDDFTNASAVISKYSPTGAMYGFKKGELMMRTITTGVSNQLIGRCIPQVQALAKADMDRMNSLIDHFSRPDVKTIIRLSAIQAAEAQRDLKKPKQP